MSPLLRLALASSRVWTELYTRGLPPLDRDARLAEVESDLWEHQAQARRDGESSVDTGFEILMRFLLGIPADLTWRYSGAAARPVRVGRDGERKMLRRLFTMLASAFTLFAGGWLIYIGVGRLTVAGPHVGFIPTAAGLAMVVGVIVSTRSRRIGAALVAAGALAVVLMAPWMIAITLPLALIAVIGIASGDDVRSGHPA
ncbi:MAG: hypothetical protein ACLGIB_13170 [Actinomycetota bacterium]